MKKLSIILVIFLILSNLSFSQVFVNKININNFTEINFCKINGIDISGKISVDYGQKKSFLKQEYITDAKGKIIRFNSSMHVVNFMYNNGWELYKFGSDSNLTHYIFKKIN